MKLVFLAIVFVFQSFLALAVDCTENNYVKEISNHGIFKYRYLKSKNTKAPVVIHLTGGPGDTAITETDPRLGDYGYIEIDYRGLGCNRQLYDEDFNLSSEDVAKDVLAVIKAENLNNYILFGISYGTVVATITAHLAENDNSISSPSAIILDGTFSYAISTEILDKAFTEVWNEFKSQTKALKLVDEHISELDLSSIEIAGLLKEILSTGTAGGSGFQLERVLPVFFLNDEYKQEFINLARLGNEKLSDEYINFYRQIACDEIWTNRNFFELHYMNGNMIRKPQTEGIICTSPYNPNLSYDAKSYKLQKTPIYYLNGLKDFKTPYEQFEYHFDQNTSVKRTVIDVPGGGHSLITTLQDFCPVLVRKLFMGDLDQNSFENRCDLAILRMEP